MVVCEKARFSELVEQTFLTEERHAKMLWIRLAPRFDDEKGPDSVRVYLDAERQKLADRVKTLLNRVEEQIDA